MSDERPTINKYDPHAGLTLEEACREMAELAPCEATLNGVHMFAFVGETWHTLLARLRAGMDKNHADEKTQHRSTELRVAYERGTCAGEVTRALVMLRAGDADTAERLMVAEIKRLTGERGES
jgi:hypothetical protein